MAVCSKADAVVVAMGPWSVMAAEWIVLPPCTGEEPQPCLRHRQGHPCGRALPRTSTRPAGPSRSKFSQGPTGTLITAKNYAE